MFTVLRAMKRGYERLKVPAGLESGVDFYDPMPHLALAYRPQMEFKRMGTPCAHEAAKLGADILMTPGAVKIDTVTALQGDLGILSLMLQGIAKGELTVAPPAPLPREAPAEPKPVEDQENAEHQ